MKLSPTLDAAAVERIIRTGVPMSDYASLKVEAVGPGTARVRVGFQPWMIRPGGTVNGPILMLAADTAMYAVVLAHIGEQQMAVTSNLNINFLRRPQPADVLAEARLLKLGRRLAVIEVFLRSDGDEDIVAHVTGTYALPG
ncbi:MAG: PaaI family thioesterase [Nevskia sp.]